MTINEPWGHIEKGLFIVMNWCNTEKIQAEVNTGSEILPLSSVVNEILVYRFLLR